MESDARSPTDDGVGRSLPDSLRPSRLGSCESVTALQRRCVLCGCDHYVSAEVVSHSHAQSVHRLLACDPVRDYAPCVPCVTPLYTGRSTVHCVDNLTRER